MQNYRYYINVYFSGLFSFFMEIYTLEIFIFAMLNLSYRFHTLQSYAPRSEVPYKSESVLKLLSENFNYDIYRFDSLIIAFLIYF